MNFTSNLLALVGHGDNLNFSQKKLVIWDTMINMGITEMQFKSKINKVKMNFEYIMIATKDHIFVNLVDQFKDQIKIKSENHLSRIVLSPFTVNPYLLYSDNNYDGELLVYDLVKQKCINTIRCHEKPILTVAINLYGNMVATSSTFGQMIRVFSVPKGEKLFTFNRGINISTMYSLNFSNDSSFLMSSSDTGTIHVF